MLPVVGVDAKIVGSPHSRFPVNIFKRTKRSRVAGVGPDVLQAGRTIRDAGVGCPPLPIDTYEAFLNMDNSESGVHPFGALNQ